MKIKSYNSHSYSDTFNAGVLLGKLVFSGMIVGLSGGLAAGKTVFSKGFLKGIGMKNVKYVSSPSFVIMQEYKISDLKVFHFDLYRINLPEELYDIGWNEVLNSKGVSIIEWVQKAEDIMPSEYMEVDMRITGKDSRKLFFKPYGKKYRDLIENIFIKINENKNK